MEEHGLEVDEKHPKLGGKCRILTEDGFISPLPYRNGLVYLKIRLYTTKEYHTLPHVIMTSDKIWDPRKFDIDASEQSANLPMLAGCRLTDYDMEGESIRALHDVNIEDDSSLEDFVSGELFEDAHDQPPDGPHKDMKFWKSPSTYQHYEHISCCARSAHNNEIHALP